MKIKKIISGILMIVLLTVCFSGCSGSKSVSNKEGKKITYLYIHATNTLNPHLKASGYMPIRAGIVETLTKIDSDLTIKPWLLESWKSEDAKNWEFQIRKGITFQNGVTLDADMVKANIEQCIKDNKGIANTLNIESMDAKGYILKIVIKKPNAALPSEFVHPETAIIDVNAPNKDTKPIGTGAFKVENFKPGSSIQLVKNSKYWDGEVKLDKVNFQFNQDSNARLQALESGSADVIYNPSVEAINKLKKDSKFTIDSTPGLRVDMLLYNVKKPIMSNPDFRKGLDSLVNRKEIVKSIMLGEATEAYGPFMGNLPFSIDYKKNEFGVDKALEYFKKAGLNVADGKVSNNGKPLRLKIISYASRAELPIISQIIQSNAKKIGLEMDIVLVEGENVDKYLKNNNDWDFGVYSMITAPRGDAGYYLNTSIAPNGVLNHGGINDSKLISITNEFNNCTDNKKRTTLAKEATSIINENAYNSYIVYPTATVAYNNRVVKWKISPSEFYMITKDLNVK